MADSPQLISVTRQLKPGITLGSIADLWSDEHWNEWAATELAEPVEIDDSWDPDDGSHVALTMSRDGTVWAFRPGADSQGTLRPVGSAPEVLRGALINGLRSAQDYRPSIAALGSSLEEATTDQLFNAFTNPRTSVADKLSEAGCGLVALALLACVIVGAYVIVTSIPQWLGIGG